MYDTLLALLTLSEKTAISLTELFEQQAMFERIKKEGPSDSQRAMRAGALIPIVKQHQEECVNRLKSHLDIRDDHLQEMGLPRGERGLEMAEAADKRIAAQNEKLLDALDNALRARAEVVLPPARALHKPAATAEHAANNDEHPSSQLAAMAG